MTGGPIQFDPWGLYGATIGAAIGFVMGWLSGYFRHR
jgi:hypothetical protein